MPLQAAAANRVFLPHAPLPHANFHWGIYNAELLLFLLMDLCLGAEELPARCSVYPYTEIPNALAEVKKFYDEYKQEFDELQKKVCRGLTFEIVVAFLLGNTDIHTLHLHDTSLFLHQ